MGNEATSSFEQATWKQITNKGVRVILQHEQTLICVQKYLTTFENAQFPTPQQIYKWRSELSPSSHIVQLYQFGVKKAGICHGFDQCYVITERVHRLNEIPNFSKPEALLLIKQTIVGLTNLRQKYGFFSPNIHRIGINDQGQVRVWVNENYASNILEEDPQGHPQRQQAVVNNLCRLIKSRVYNNELKGEYPFHMNFEKAKKHITDLMIRDRNYLIDKIYKDRAKFIQQYSAKRQEFSRTKSRQQLSEVSKGSKIIQQHSALNYSFQKLHSIRAASLSRELTPNKNFVISNDIYSNMPIRQQIVFNKINKVFYEPGNRNVQIPINYVNQQRLSDKTNHNTQKQKQVSHESSPQQIVQKKTIQGHSPTKIKSWGRKSYENNTQKQQKNQKILGVNKTVQNKVSNNYPPLPKQTMKSKIGSKANLISAKSQIRIDNNLQEVDSVILVQDNDDSLLDEVRDYVPIH